MARGKTHILLDQETRESLRDVYKRARQAQARPQEVARIEPRGGAGGEIVSIEAGQAQVARPKVQAPVQAAVLPLVPLSVAGANRGERLASLAKQAQNWAMARNLGTLGKDCILGEGNPEAKILFVVDAVSYEDLKHKRPLAGESGKKLDAVLSAMETSRDQVYITHLVKYRPISENQTIDTRSPNAQEIAACLPLLREQIKVIQPTCLVLMGRVPVLGLLNRQDVEAARGAWHEFEGVATRVCQHPANLLISSISNKRVFWEDMMAVMEKVGMPISDKQRRYFLPK